MSTAEPTPLSAHLILPGWWLDAFDAAGRHEGGDSAMTLARAARLAPAMAAADLNALALLANCLQEQLLASDDPRYVIRVAEHVKHAGNGGRGGRFNFERQMQLMSATRVLCTHGDGSLATVPLFVGERWLGDDAGDATAGLTIELTPGALTHELILGVSDPHADLARAMRGELTGAAVLGARASTAVWRSLWLELPVVEQQLLARLETALQEDRRWLSLDGVVGLPIDELFSDVKLPEARGAGQHGELARRLKALVKLGKRLGDHGFLTPTVGDQYLAFGEGDDTRLMVVWQVARERLAADAVGRHSAAARRFLLKHRIPQVAATLCQLMPAPESARRRLDDLRTAALTHTAPATGSFNAALLLWELECRLAHGRDQFPLPDGVRASLVEWDDGAAPAERLTRFEQLLGETPELLRAIVETPYGSFASPATLGDKAFVEHALRLGRHGDTDLGHTSNKIKPRLVGAVATDAAASAKPVAARPKGGVSGALTSRMRRIANDELNKMRAQHPDRYVALKRAYLESLDEAGKHLMLDVQKRMQPGMFEEHLKQRLVKFMVDQPGSWRSSL